MTRKELDELRDKRFAITRGHEQDFEECFSRKDRSALVLEIENDWASIKLLKHDRDVWKLRRDDVRHHLDLREIELEEARSTIARQAHLKGPGSMETEIKELKAEVHDARADKDLWKKKTASLFKELEVREADITRINQVGKAALDGMRAERNLLKGVLVKDDKDHALSEAYKDKIDSLVKEVVEVKEQLKICDEVDEETQQMIEGADKLIVKNGDLENKIFHLKAEIVELKKTPKDDNPLDDCTDAAHPAWLRGSDYSLEMMVMQVGLWLDGQKMTGAYSHEGLETLKRRIEKIGNENRELKDAVLAATKYMYKEFNQNGVMRANVVLSCFTAISAYVKQLVETIPKDITFQSDRAEEDKPEPPADKLIKEGGEVRRDAK